MSHITTNKKAGTQFHKWTPMVVSEYAKETTNLPPTDKTETLELGGTNNTVLKQQTINVYKNDQQLPQVLHSMPLKKKFGMAILALLTFGNVAVGSLEAAGLTNLFPSHVEVVEEQQKLNFVPAKLKEEMAKPKVITQEAIDAEVKRIQELEGLIPEEKDLSVEELKKHIQEFGDARGFSMSQDEVKEMLQLRAEYNLTKNADLFNKYLPYRCSIKNNAEKLARYDSLVKEIQDKIGVVFAKEHFPDSYNSLPKLDNCQKGDLSSCYMMVAGLVELLHNRPDIINNLLEKHEKSQLVLFQKPPVNSEFRGYSKRNGIMLVNSTFWSGVIWNNNGYLPCLHEYIHAIDGRIFTNGILPDMTSTQKKEFKKIRQELFKHFKSGNLIYYHNNTHFAYAFENGIEFLPTTIETFYENPKTLYEISPKLYNIYSDYFKLDPLNGYKDLIINEPAYAKNNGGVLKIDDTDGIFR